MKLTIEINGNDEGDVALTLEEVARLVNAGFTSGHDKNESGNFIFTVQQQEEVTR